MVELFDYSEIKIKWYKEGMLPGGDTNDGNSLSGGGAFSPSSQITWYLMRRKRKHSIGCHRSYIYSGGTERARDYECSVILENTIVLLRCVWWSLMFGLPAAKKG